MFVRFAVLLMHKCKGQSEMQESGRVPWSGELLPEHSADGKRNGLHQQRVPTTNSLQRRQQAGSGLNNFAWGM